LATVLALDPRLVVLDEPTAGLDPFTRRELVGQIRRLAGRRGFSLIVISHDLSDVSELADRSMVLYAGEAMEIGSTRRVIEQPAHPYSWALLNAYPVMSTTKDLRPIRGRPPDPRAVPPGCPYHTRCTQAESVCWEEHPDLRESEDRWVACHFGGLKTLLSAVDVSKTYRSGRSQVPALQGVSFSIREGESVGIIGASGSGKSTLARMGLRLVLISHDMAVVRKVTDRIVVLDGGRVVEEGPSHVVSSVPRSRAGRRLIDAAATFAFVDGAEVAVAGEGLVT